VDAAWGHVGLGPRSRVTAQDTVYATYCYSLMRMDTLQVGADGTVSLKAGEPHVSAPVPPDADPGCLALAHVWVPYRATEVAPGQVWPVAETAGQAVTGSTPGCIPRTLAKLRAGRPVKIVCWGDSVTAGGNASSPERRYVDVFAAGLRERFPAATIDVENVSVGGSHSRQWLHPDQYRFRNLPPDETPCRFQRVLDAQPDLVTIEFVNDAGMSAPQVEETYREIRRRLGDAEIILITPHFTMPALMGIEHLWEPEKRPYVLALRDFAGRHGVALADASARWEHLWKEGLPYLTLLHNTINHPDDRGHRLFAEELWKCFGP
jgi:lysophospholipase L1-like esterase